MLTKTLKFDDDVLSILRGMEWSDDGLTGKLTCGQLDRKIYTKVNKALETMGGKWNRSAGGHKFKTDPRPQVEGLIDTGALTVERDGFFETPREVVERMIELVPFNPDDDILEPSAGLGAIARVIVEHGGDPVCIEKNKDRRMELYTHFAVACTSDFLKHDMPYDRIYMNPPFEEGQDIDHVRHAYDLLADGGALVSVMSEGVFFRLDHKATEFRAWLDEVNAYSEKLPEGAFKSSGTGVNTRLVVIHK